MGHRHRARRLAMQGLCCLDFQGQRAMDLVVEFINDSPEPPGTRDSAMQLIRRTFANAQQIDQILSKHATHWDLSRLALVDRNILRLAVEELLLGSTPPKVVITEAIKLAKEFSSSESPRFINGVIDSVVRELIPKDGCGADTNTP